MEASLLIEVNHVTKLYGSQKALSDVSFKLRNGHIYGLVGPEGAGKTTVMHILAGCLPPTEGEVFINGYDLGVHPKEAKRRIGYLPSTRPLFGKMTPYEYLSFMAEVKGVREERLEQRIKGILAATGLAPVADRLICRLSDGEQLCLGLAQTLVGTPDMILLDHPTAGLDPQERGALLALIHRLSDKLTVVISAPTLDEIRPLCEYVICLDGGRVVSEETVVQDMPIADPEIDDTYTENSGEVDAE